MTDNNSFFTEGQTAQILKFLGAGAALGISSNLMLNMLSYLKSKKDNADYKDKLNQAITAPTYEIDLGALQKSASIKEAADRGFLNQTLANALSLVLGGAGLYGGYVLADKLHDNIREAELSAQEKTEAEDYYKKLFLLNKLKTDAKFKEDLEKSLDKEEEEEELEKTAAVSSVTGPALGLLLLTALGSGLLTRSILSKQFPLVREDSLEELRPELFSSPEKIKFKIIDTSKEKKNKTVKKDSDKIDSIEPKDPNEEVIDSDDAFSKAFSKLSFERLEPLCKEAFIKIVYNIEKEKQEGSVTNLIKAASYGFCQELENVAAKAKTAEAIFDYTDRVVENFQTAKFASEITPQREQLAISFLANSPEMDSVFPQLAAEFVHNSPTYCKLASKIKKEDEPVYAISLAVSALQSRGKTLDKYASEFINQLSISEDFNPDSFEDNSLVTSEVCKKLLDANISTKYHQALNI